MLLTPNRDLPEVVSELSIEMPEMRSELSAPSGRVDQLQRTVEERFRLKREEIRQNTDRLIDAFLRNMAPLIERVLTHEVCYNRIVNSQA
jgi:hypothetical protein